MEASLTCPSQYSIVLIEAHTRLGLTAGCTAIFDATGATAARPGEVVAVRVGAGARQAIVCRVSTVARLHRGQPMKTFELADGGKLAFFERASVRVDRMVRVESQR